MSSVQRWAMIDKNGVVINICLWDGLLSTWQPPEGIEMQLAPDHLSIGYTWDGVSWHEPVIEESTIST